MEDGITDEAYWPAWPPEGQREPSETMLQYARRDTWIGLPVIIMRGRTKGALGRVMGTGSGWVQIRQAPADGSDPMLADDAEEVSKRAVELMVVKGYDDPDKIPMAPANEILPRDKLDEVRAAAERESQPDDAPLHTGDLVRIIGGNPPQYVGKIGRIVVVNRGTLNISIKNDLILTKKRTEVELVSGRMLGVLKDEKGDDVDDSDGDAKRKDDGSGTGRSSRISAKRQEMVGKRVQIVGTPQTGSIVRVTAGGSYVIALDTSDEVTKRKEDVQIIEEGDAEESVQEQDEESMAEEPSSRGAQRSAKVSPKAVDRVARRRTEKRGGGEVENRAEKDQPIDLGTVRNVTRRATRRNSRLNGVANGKRNKESSEQYAQTRLDASRRARQEFMVGFLQRQRVKVEHTLGISSRPNLTEWIDRIQGPYDEEDDDDIEQADAYVPLLYDAPFCATCSLEMAPGDRFCWNPACTDSPVYDPMAPPLQGAVVTAREALASLQSPRKPGFIDYALLKTNKSCADDDYNLKNPRRDEVEEHGGSVTESTRPYHPSKRKRLQSEMIYSPLVSYELRANSVWLGQSKPGDPNQTTEGYFGRGWRSGLVYDEPGVKGCDQEDSAETGLEYRWKRGLVA